MKRIYALSLFVLMTAFQSFAQQTLSTYTVYQAGSEGYKTYRIPAIVQNTNGELLAFAEARVNGGADYGHIEIVVKHSTDGGKSWSPLQLVASNGDFQAGNPAPVIDISDPKYPKGRIFLFYNTGNSHEMEIREGKNIRRICYKTSTDGGHTWSSAVDITSQVHRLNHPKIDASWNHPEDWRSYANTPGHAFQFSYGKYQGRLYIAANHSAGKPPLAKKAYQARGFYNNDNTPGISNYEDVDYQAHGFYSDDHGKTFKLSTSVPFKGSNESSACQIGKSGLMMNSRNQLGTFRVVSISKDGGETWKKSFADKQLPDPVCQGAIVNIGLEKGKDILAFTNPDSQNTRDSLTLRISFDSGKTWPYRQLISPANAKIKNSSAYSDVVKIDENQVGVLYEVDFYSRIVFVPIKWK